MSVFRPAWLPILASVAWLHTASRLPAETPVGDAKSQNAPPSAKRALNEPVAFDQIPLTLRESVRQVMQSPTLVVNGTPEAFACKPADYYWCLDHPDRAGQAWQRLGAKSMSITARGNGRFGWSDGQESDVQWQVAQSGPRIRVWFAEGKVRPAALLPLVPVRAVLVMHHEEGKNSTGQPMIRHRADLYIHTDSKTAAAIAKILGASAPKVAEQYVGQLQMFFGGLAWYVDQHPEFAAVLISEPKK